MKIKDFLRNLPVIGIAFYAEWADIKRAWDEFWVCSLLSTSPLWLGALVLILNKPDLSFWTCLYLTVNTGELFLYSTATLAPVFYLAYQAQPFKGESPMPGSLFRFVLLILIWGVCWVIFGMQRASVIFNDKVAFRISIGLFILSNALYFSYLLVEKLLEKNLATRTTEEGTADFVAEVKKHRENE